MRPRSPLWVNRIAIAVCLAASLGNYASAQGLPVVPPPPVPVSTPPPVPVSAPTTAVADKLSGGCPAISEGGGTQFAVDVLLGQFTGFRGQAAVFRTPDRAFVLEGYYGAILDKLGSGEGVGGGARYYFHRTDRAGDNSVLFGPGVGAYYHIKDKVWMAAPTVDIGWVHAIGDNGAFELGLNAGIGLGLSDGRRDYYDYNRKVVGGFTPLFSLYWGFRF